MASRPVSSVRTTASPLISARKFAREPKDLERILALSAVDAVVAAGGAYGVVARAARDIVVAKATAQVVVALGPGGVFGRSRRGVLEAGETNPIGLDTPEGEVE